MKSFNEWLSEDSDRKNDESPHYLLYPLKKGDKIVGYARQETVPGLKKIKDGVYKKSQVPKCHRCGKAMQNVDSNKDFDEYRCGCGKTARRIMK